MAEPATTNTSNMDRHSLTVRLPDGRTLGYAEYGDPDGEPLLHFHGFPASRVDGRDLHDTALRLKIRLLSIDRPGFGLSTHDPKRRIGDWPRDVAHFTELLGLSRFAVLGVSGGGPYALACAKDLPPTKLAAVGVVAGAPMWDHGFRSEGYPWFSKLGYLGAKYCPSGFRVISTGLTKMVIPLLNKRPVKHVIDRKIQKQLRIWDSKGPSIRAPAEHKEAPTVSTDRSEAMPQDNDGAAISAADARRTLVRSLKEHFSSGAAGFVHEIQLLTREWDFKYADITYDTVQIWQGTNDENIPPATVRAMSELIPRCVLTESDDTHYTIGRAYYEILTQIMAYRDINVGGAQSAMEISTSEVRDRQT